MYPTLDPTISNLEAGKNLIRNIAPVAKYRNKVKNSQRNSKQQMWPLWLEDVFLDALLLVPPIGQTRVITGVRPPTVNGRNTLIAKYLSMHGWMPTIPRSKTPLQYMKGGKGNSNRARKQVSSHCQVLKTFYSTLVTSHFIFHVKRRAEKEKSLLNSDTKLLNSYEILTAIANGRLPDKQPNYGYFSKLFNANNDIFLWPKQFWMFVLSSKASHGEKHIMLGNGTIKTHIAGFTSNSQCVDEIGYAYPNLNENYGDNDNELLHAGNPTLFVLHEYARKFSQTESSSIGAISRKWAVYFPRLSEKLIAAHDDTRPSDEETSRCVIGPCDTLHFDVTLDLQGGPDCLEVSELSCIAELSICRSALYNCSWRTVTSVTKPDELRLSRSEPEVWDLNEPAETSTSHAVDCNSDGLCRCNEHNIRVPFPVNTWAATLTKLAPYITADRDNEGKKPRSRSSPREARNRKIEDDNSTRNVTGLLSEVAVYQEIWSAPNDDSSVSNVDVEHSWTRRAVILWTFTSVQKRKDGSPEQPGTTWRFLTKLDPFSQYHQQHAYVDRSSTASPHTSILLDQDTSRGYATMHDGPSATPIVAPATHEWPLVGLGNPLPTAFQYNNCISSFDNTNTTTSFRSNEYLNSFPGSVFDNGSRAGTNIQIPDPSRDFGTIFTDPYLFESVPTGCNASFHLPGSIPSDRNTTDGQVQEIEGQGADLHTAFMNPYPNSVPVLWNNVCQFSLQEGPTLKYKTPEVDSL
ncbi:hypothetical protein F5Y14DRAFT_414 [Nemania sp. NC0429]|nr:hypothetical protein F5Y14DRAFT_414 [Nemania sp. NC0429]